MLVSRTWVARLFAACGGEGSGVVKRGGGRTIAHNIVCFTVAGVLLIAAGLRAQALFEQWQIRGASSLQDLPALQSLGAILLEFFIATWLLSGLAPVAARLATISLLSIFLAVGLWHLLARDDECGCFGRVRTNPALTSGIDVTLLTAMWRFGCGADAPAIGYGSAYVTRLLLATAAGCCISISSYVASGANTRDSLLYGAMSRGHVSQTDTSREIIPSRWRGRRLRLLDHINSGADLKSGTWLLVLYRADCDECRAILPRLAAFAGNFRNDELRVAFVQVPPYRTSGPLPIPAFVRTGRLDQSAEWIVSTPASFWLREGTVVTGFDDGDSVLQMITEGARSATP